MDFTTLFSSVVSSLGITAAGVWWLGRQWVNHKLKRHEAQWREELEQKKVAWQGEMRTEVETTLGERAAEQRGAPDPRRVPVTLGTVQAST